MSFLNPLILWILPAAGVPILLHLLNKRPPKKIRFSHIGWLKAVHKTTMPKKKLHEMLLLITRTLLVLFLIFVFARPVIHSGTSLTGGTSSESMVFLLDVSASMSAVEAGRSSLDWTKERLQAALRKIPSGVKVGVVVYSDQVEQELAPTDERSRVTTTLQNAKETLRGTDVFPALKLGLQMLENQPKGQKTLVVVSDLARHGWLNALEKSSDVQNAATNVRVVLWEAASNVPNAGVSEASLGLSEEGLLSGAARFHYSDSLTNEPTWKLHLNDRVVAQGAWNSVVTGGNTLALRAQFPEGGFYSGSVELSADSAPFDDAYYLAGRIPKGFRLLLVDGESGLAPADSEVYYLRSALESPRDPRIDSIQVLRPEALASVHFNSYDAIVLANVAGIPDGAGKEAELLKWIENGGGLLMTAGSKWPHAPTVPLRLFRSIESKSAAEKISVPDPKEPFFSDVSGIKDFEWGQISVEKHVALEKENTATVLLTLASGDPLLVRKQLGKGFVMCLTTTLDRAWTNFPAKPVFAPLMRELVAALADPLREQTVLQGFVGVPVRFNVPVGVKSVSVVAPSGVVSGANVTRDGVMEWPAPTTPGLYKVKTDRRDTDFYFAVNIPHLDQEGDLTRLSEKDARKIFPDTAVNYVAGGTDRTQLLLNALQGKDMTNPLLASLFVLFGLETLLGFARRTNE